MVFLTTVHGRQTTVVELNKILREFWEKHQDCEQQLKAWHLEVNRAVWNNSNELKLAFPSVSILKDNRVCFDIKGNKYRLIIKVSYEYQMVWIRFIGTHGEYDRIDANTV